MARGVALMTLTRMRTTGLTAAVLVVLMISGGAGATYQGFCWQKGMVLAPEYKIDAAIHSVLASYPPVLETFRSTGQGAGVVSYRKPKRAVAYHDISEFKRMNPDCCALVMHDREGWTPSVFQRVTGQVSSLVMVRYQVRHGERGVAITHEDYIRVSNCGAALRF